MDPKHLHTLEYDKILERLAKHTAFSAGRDLALALRPTTDLQEAIHWQHATSEACRLIELKGGMSVGGALDVRPLVGRAVRSVTLLPTELLEIRDTLRAGKSLRQTLTRMSGQFPLLAQEAERIEECTHVVSEISRCLNDRGEVVDAASTRLARIRTELRAAHDRLLEKLNRIMQSSETSSLLQEAIVTQRGGRYVLPLRSEFKGRLQGIVHDQSASGATLFVEPLATVELNNQWRELQLDEQREVDRILAALTDLVGQESLFIARTVEALATLDLHFAKALYAEELRGSEPKLVGFSPRAEREIDGEQIPASPGATIRLAQARHPLLSPETVVPIDVTFDESFFVLVVTGPNTGGKTVSLKTVGLLSLMAQSGLHIPALDCSTLTVFDSVYCDIGDEQSIEQSLSTFSSHMRNIISILDRADSQSLVLLDELGAGTDPVEGSALARAELSHLVGRRITSLATTHYSELKLYAQVTPGVENASVEFNLETLSPTYELTIGLPGRSNAFAIASRLGLPQLIVEEARSLVAPETIEADQLLGEIKQAHREAQQTQAAASATLQEARANEELLRVKLADLDAAKIDILAEARETAQKELDELRRELRQIRGRFEPTTTARQAAAEAEAELDEIEADLPPVPKPAPAAPPREAIQVGDTIWIRPIKAKGEVVELGNGSVVVMVGHFRLNAGLGDIEFRSRPPKSADAQPGVGVAVPVMPSPGSELDLRGMRVEEVLPRLEKYMDDAFMAGLPMVRIIHGKGTGTLRRVVREALDGHPLVGSFASGAQNEGGDGVTVAKMVSR
jgi:DNA mismatch repair protein MutS2